MTSSMRKSAVLILVVVEYGLGLFSEELIGCYHSVLILVVVEYGLGQQAGVLRKLHH